jgi:hypothetical protein
MACVVSSVVSICLQRTVPGGGAELLLHIEKAGARLCETLAQFGNRTTLFELHNGAPQLRLHHDSILREDANPD